MVEVRRPAHMALELATRTSHHANRTMLTSASTPAIAGPVYCRWHKTAAHLGLDPKKVCGPCLLSRDPQTRVANCCYGHKANDPSHAIQQYKGKPFNIQDHVPEFGRLLLTELRTELIEERKAKSRPPGTPRKVNGALIYPNRHFA